MAVARSGHWMRMREETVTILIGLLEFLALYDIIEDRFSRAPPIPRHKSTVAIVVYVTDSFCNNSHVSCTTILVLRM
jgi:hypothetical protein